MRDIPYNDKWCNLIVKDGQHFITMPNGDIIPHQIWSRVTDKHDEPPYAIVKLFVNLKPEEK